MSKEDLERWARFLRRKYGILWPIGDLEEEDKVADDAEAKN